MIPYNICESKWLNKVKRSYKEYQPIYEIFVGISLIIIFVLTVLTLLSSFL
mgnify:FL=1|jgi:hypothetical protein